MQSYEIERKLNDLEQKYWYLESEVTSAKRAAKKAEERADEAYSKAYEVEQDLERRIDYIENDIRDLENKDG